MRDQPRPTETGLPDIEVKPRNFEEVLKEQERTMKSFFSFEQWCWILWLEVSNARTFNPNVEG